MRNANKTLSFSFSILIALASSQAKAFTGRDFSALLTLQCADKTWASYSTWARETGFNQRVFKSTKVVNIKDDSVYIDKDKFEIQVKSNSSLLLVAQNKRMILASDLCDLTLKAVKLKEYGLKIFDFLFERAQADKLVEEDKLVDQVNVIGFGALTVMCGTAGPLALLPAVPFAGSVANLDAINNFEEILNQKFNLSCDSTQMTIQNEEKKIFVLKTKNQDGTISYKIDILKNNNVIVPNLISYGDVKSREFLKSYAAKCNSKEDADRILKELALIQNRAKIRMNAIAGDASFGRRQDANILR